MERFRNSGLTLSELLMTVSIVSIITVLGVPAFMQLNDERKLGGAVEGAYFFLQQAKSEAITQGNDITVDFNAGADWCLGISDAGTCACNTSYSCNVNGVESVFNASDYPDIKMTDLTFGSDDQTVFESVRGLASGNSGSFVLTNNETEVKLLLSTMGRVRICVVSGSLGKYEAC